MADIKMADTTPAISLPMSGLKSSQKSTQVAKSAKSVMGINANMIKNGKTIVYPFLKNYSKRKVKNGKCDFNFWRRFIAV